MPSRLYVCRAQSKAERLAFLKQKFQEVQDVKQRFKGDNLYIKNLDDSVDDDKLREAFEPFGTITSAKVMKDEKGNSRGFGFVSFMSSEEATKAVTEMHLKVVNGKPLYVGLAERRDDRISRLQQRYKLHHQFRPTGGGLQPAAVPPQMQFSSPPQMFAGYSAPGGMPSHPGRPQVMYNVPASNWRPQANRPYPQSQQIPMSPVYPAQMVPMTHMAPSGQGLMRAAPRGRGASNTPQRPSFKYTSNVRNRGEGGGPPGGLPVMGPTGFGDGQMDPRVLGEAGKVPHPQEKRMIGERLYALIKQTDFDLAGKITGMMLEMDNNELLHLLENNNQLKAKIDEAKRVLEAHNPQHPPQAIE
eukprot:GHVN01064149.1.p1 GENE.GHVN01064149.1~~GHVN01064149.1.p1  ORF type:complete len:410 (-),score=92.74 GHVN01064149.1:446-1519(-)